MFVYFVNHLGFSYYTFFCEERLRKRTSVRERYCKRSVTDHMCLVS